MRSFGRWLSAAFVIGLVSANAQGTVPTIKIDGSSTVYPISEGIAESFGEKNRKVRVVVGQSGTGGGFKKFCNGETDINNASRTIKDTERAECKKHGVEFVELPVAHDGISVVVNSQNSWAKSLTVAELKRIWEPGSKITMWSDIRPEWPKNKIKLYGPGTDSGTFGFFTEAVNGKSQVSRPDFMKSEDDNTLVQGVTGDKYALGYFGYAYFVENAKRLKVLGIDSGKGIVLPTHETIRADTYKPLSRTIYIYISKKALARAEGKEFARFYADQSGATAEKVGFIALNAEEAKRASEIVSLATK